MIFKDVYKIQNLNPILVKKMTTLTLVPFRNIPNYFTQENVLYIKKTVEDILCPSFIQKYTVDNDSILRVMHRVIDERLEPIPKMLERVVMYITSEIRQFELERARNIDLELGFKFTGGIYDNLYKIGPDIHNIKMVKNPSTLRFYHTYVGDAFP